jgi:cysteine desulfurase
MKRATPDQPVYLDYNATAPLLPAAQERMLSALTRYPGNPSSPHAFGQAAKDVLETGRARLAGLAGFGRRELLFTSGGSEGNNMLLRWLAEQERPVHLITSPIEHPSLLRSCEWLERQGVAVSRLPVEPSGLVAVEAVTALIRAETRLVSLMAANNETGVIQPVARLAALVQTVQSERKILVHTDAVQAFGRIPLPLKAWGVDAATLAAHKLGGPKGIGAVAIREGAPIPSFILGGRQERGHRAGTESVALVEGFVAAAEWVFGQFEELAGRLTRLRDRLIENMRDLDGFFLNGAEAPRLPNTANLGFEGVSAQSLLVALDLRGVAVSTGSACSSGAIEPSQVLRAMGVPEPRLTASLRISLGHASSEEDVERCAEVMREEVRRLRRTARGRAGGRAPDRAVAD